METIHGIKPYTELLMIHQKRELLKKLQKRNLDDLERYEVALIAEASEVRKNGSLQMESEDPLELSAEEKAKRRNYISSMRTTAELVDGQISAIFE